MSSSADGGLALRDQLVAAAEALVRGESQAAAQAMARAVESCNAMRRAGVQLDREQLTELTRLCQFGLRASAAVRRRLEAAQQALSASRSASAAYGSFQR